jgi:hypothetical protein
VPRLAAERGIDHEVHTGNGARAAPSGNPLFYGDFRPRPPAGE